MIHIIKDFYLTADTYQFILVKSSGKIRKDTGKEDNEVIGYYPTVEATLRALYRYFGRRHAKTASTPLREAVAALQTIADDLRKAYTDANLGDLRLEDLQ